MGDVVHYKERERQLIKMETIQQSKKELAVGLSVSDMYLNRSYLDGFSSAPIINLYDDGDLLSKLRVLKITKLVVDTKEKVNDKLMNVYSALYNLNCSVAIIIKSDGEGVDFYIGIQSEKVAASASDLLQSTLKGNFPGVEYSNMGRSEVGELLDSINANHTSNMASVSIVPSLREEYNSEGYVQGIEKFIDSMTGKSYVMISIAAPLDKYTLEQRKHGYEELYSSLTPHNKYSMNYSKNDSVAVNKAISNSFSKSVNRSVSNTNTDSRSSSRGTNSSSSYGSSSNDSFSMSGMNFGWGSNEGYSTGSFGSYTSGLSFSQAVSDSSGSTESTTDQEGKTTTTGTSEAITINYENKGITTLLERASEQLERFKLSESYGMWECCGYFMSESPNNAVLAASTYKALMTGNTSNVESAHINFWGANQKNSISSIMKYISSFMHPVAEIPARDGYSSQHVTPTALVNGNELPILMGLPKKSVDGVAVIEMAEFGRNVIYENNAPERAIDIGSIYHMGVVERQRVNLNLDLFSSHCFITGSSGSGKSFATYHLLDKALQENVQIMIIEPAKGEYKQILGGVQGIRVFTTDPSTCRLLRINPFKFPESMHVLSHIDQLIQIFNASWPLYAAMPAILKTAVVNSYKKCGWDVQNSIWIPDICDHKYPVFADLLEALPEIINNSDYSSESQGDYKGALMTRVESMTTGITGLIFRNSEGVDDEYLFDSNVVIDLSELGSDETIALLMGVLIMKLNEYRKAQRKKGAVALNQKLKHLTVLEEAHNLLKRTSQDQSQESSNLVGKSVEMIANSIREMRTYGEGFLIIDQSPLAVDLSAIENTATKIIMNTPTKDACEELGSALSLNDEQTKELSRLNVGVAAVFQKGWLSPVLMKVDNWEDKYAKDIRSSTLQELKDLRRKIVDRLYDQYGQKKYNVLQFRGIMKSSTLPFEKRQEFNDILLSYVDKFPINKEFDGYLFGKLLVEVCGCEQLFVIVPQKGILNYEEIVKLERRCTGACLEWLNKMIKAIKVYINIEDDTFCAFVIMMMLRYIGNMGKFTEHSKDKITMVCWVLHHEFDIDLI